MSTSMKQFFQPLKARELQEHMISTYFCLRIGLALIAIVLPLGLLLSALWIGLLNSMSAYYHTPTAPQLHAACAVAFFLSVAAVCLTASHRANRCGMTDCRNRFRGQYATIGIAMILLPAIAAGLAFTLRPPTVVFWIEFVAIAVFAWYWILQTMEYWDVDVAAISGTPSDNG
jgi:hypothetical protein